MSTPDPLGLLEPLEPPDSPLSPDRGPVALADLPDPFADVREQQEGLTPLSDLPDLGFDQADRLRAAQDAARERTAAQEAQVDDLAARLEVDRDVVLGLEEEAQLELERRELEQADLPRDRPTLSRLMQQPDLHSQTREDYKVLADIERILRGDNELSTMEALGDIVNNPLRMFTGVGTSAAARFKQQMLDWQISQTQQQQDVIEQHQGLYRPEMAYAPVGIGMDAFVDPAGAEERLATVPQYENSVARLMREGRELEEKVKAATPPGMNWLESGARSGLISSVSQIPGLALSMVTRNPNLGLAVMGSTEFSNARNEARRDGLTESQAFFYGLVNGAIEVATEKLPTDSAVKALTEGWKKNAIKFVLSELGGEQVASFGQAFTSAVAGVGEQGRAAREAWETGDYEKLQRMAADMSRETLIASLVGSGTQMGAVSALSYTVNKVQGAVADHNRRVAIEELIADSKLRENNPTRFAQVMKAIGLDANVSHIHIDSVGADALLQQTELPLEDPNAEAFADLKRQVAEAKAKGDDVSIPLEEYALRFVGTPMQELLSEHVRMTEDGMTMAEAMNTDIRARLAELQKQGADSMRGQSRVYDSVYNQLVQAEVDAETASDYAMLHVAVFETWAQRPGVKAAGMTADDLMQRYGLGIMRELDPRLTQHEEKVKMLDILLDRMRAGDVPTDQEAFGPSLTQALADQIDPSQMQIDLNAGVDLSGFNTIAQNAFDMGYLPDNTPTALLEAVVAEAAGNPVYSELNANPDVAPIRQQMDMLQAELDSRMVDLSTLDNKAVREVLGQEVESDAFKQFSDALAPPVAEDQDLQGATRDEQVVLETTGELYDVKVDVQKEFNQLRERRNAVEALIECVRNG